jgi:hypothetical protein
MKSIVAIARNENNYFDVVVDGRKIIFKWSQLLSKITDKLKLKFLIKLILKLRWRRY